MFKEGDLVQHKGKKKIYIVLEEMGGGKIRARHYSLEWKQPVSKTLIVYEDNLIPYKKGE